MKPKVIINEKALSLELYVSGQTKMFSSMSDLVRYINDNNICIKLNDIKVIDDEY